MMAACTWLPALCTPLHHSQPHALSGFKRPLSSGLSHLQATTDSSPANLRLGRPRHKVFMTGPRQLCHPTPSLGTKWGSVQDYEKRGGWAGMSTLSDYLATVPFLCWLTDHIRGGCHIAENSLSPRTLPSVCLRLCTSILPATPQTPKAKTIRDTLVAVDPW